MPAKQPHKDPPSKDENSVSTSPASVGKRPIEIRRACASAMFGLIFARACLRLTSSISTHARAEAPAANYTAQSRQLQCSVISHLLANATATNWQNTGVKGEKITEVWNAIDWRWHFRLLPLLLLLPILRLPISRLLLEGSFKTTVMTVLRMRTGRMPNAEKLGSYIDWLQQPVLSRFSFSRQRLFRQYSTSTSTGIDRFFRCPMVSGFCGSRTCTGVSWVTLI